MQALPSVTAIRNELQAERQKAIEQYRAHPNPDKLLRALCNATDRALQALVMLYPLPANAALAAVGGYGRGELYPYSDVDLLVLLSTPPTEQEEARLGELVAALWDLGIEPGYSVRTIDQCLEEARSDITVETSLLETRYLAGKRSLVSQFDKAIYDQLDPKSFFRAKLAEMQQRHARFQETPYSLEPNCKESPGGLRDLQVIAWMAKAAGFGATWSEIARKGMLTEYEARELRRAEQAFKRLRIELHLLANRREDRVVFDLQHPLAERYQIKPTSTRRASEILMQRYYWAARLVTQLNTVLVATLEEQLFPVPREHAIALDEHFFNLQSRLDIADENIFNKEPRLLLKAFLVVQQHPEISGMTARTLRAIWHARTLIDAKFRNDPVNRSTFLEILQQPQGIVHAIRRMTMLNILPRYLPPFRRVVGQMQHDLFHIYTVDQHTLQVIRNLRRFTMPEHAQEYPLCSTLMANLEKHWLLYVAALFHDIAKGRGGDHSELGAVEVKRFATKHGLSKEDTDFVVFLVKQHLLMSKVAQKHDLSNPAVIENFAQQVGSQRRLTALYLLTVADIRGTSPKVWNAWKAKLLEDLFHLTRAALGGQSENPNTVLQQRLAQATELTRQAGLADASKQAFWNSLDIAYFLRHDARDIAWHTISLHDNPSPDKPIVKVRHVLNTESLEILVYTHDVTDLFSRICTYLALRKLDVLDAKIHTTHHGYALDSFVVQPASSSELRNLPAIIEKELPAFLSGQETKSLSARHAIAHRPSRLSKAFPINPSIELQPYEDSEHWRLAIVATDRPGLLADIAQVFTQFGIGVETAKVMTLGERVEDVFIINSENLNQPRIQRQFERDMFKALSRELSNAA